MLINKCHKELRKVWRQLYLIKWPYIQTQDNVKNILHKNNLGCLDMKCIKNINLLL